MQPIDKFTNLDAVYYDSDTTKEDIVLDYVWDFAMKIHPAKPMVTDDLILDGSKAIKIFKKRYNERLIESKFPILGCHLLDGCLLAPV